MLAFNAAGVACSAHTTNDTCMADKANYCFYDPSTNPVCDTDLADTVFGNCSTGAPATAPRGAEVCQYIDTLIGMCANATTRAACDTMSGLCEYSNVTCTPVIDFTTALLSIAASQGDSVLTGPYLAQIATCAPYSSEASCLGLAATNTTLSAGGNSSNSTTSSTALNSTASGSSSSTARNAAGSSVQMGGAGLAAAMFAALAAMAQP
jgi:hypothetical protein